MDGRWGGGCSWARLTRLRRPRPTCPAAPRTVPPSPVSSDAVDSSLVFWHVLDTQAHACVYGTHVCTHAPTHVLAWSHGLPIMPVLPWEAAVARAAVPTLHPPPQGPRSGWATDEQALSADGVQGLRLQGAGWASADPHSAQQWPFWGAAWGWGTACFTGRSRQGDPCRGSWGARGTSVPA